jgi:hypothetical protein
VTVFRGHDPLPSVALNSFGNSRNLETGKAGHGCKCARGMIPARSDVGNLQALIK